MKELRVGIIGLGGIARSHCDAISHLDEIEIVAVADLFAEKRQEYMQKYAIPKGYATHTELLQDGEIDALITQNVGHLVRSALRVLRAKCDGASIFAAQERIRIDIVIRENLP